MILHSAAPEESGSTKRHRLYELSLDLFLVSHTLKSDIMLLDQSPEEWPDIEWGDFQEDWDGSSMCDRQTLQTQTGLY